MLDLINSVNTEVALPIPFKASGCVNLTQEQNNTISSTLNDISKCLGEFETSAQRYNNQLDDEIWVLYNLSKNYMTSIQEAQTLVCPPINIKVNATSVEIANIQNYVNAFNFRAPNWIEGGKTLQQYQA